MTCPAIDSPTSCEIRVVNRFLHARNVSVAEIHCEICVAVYGHSLPSGSQSNLRKQTLN
jgi:hypothetical protein